MEGLTQSRNIYLSLIGIPPKAHRHNLDSEYSFTRSHFFVTGKWKQLQKELWIGEVNPAKDERLSILFD